MEVNNCGSYNFGLNEICLFIDNIKNDCKLFLSTVPADCESCPRTNSAEVIGGSNKTIVLNLLSNAISNLRLSAQFEEDCHKRDLACDVFPDLNEGGIYSLKVEDSKCGFYVIKKPDNIYTPLFIILGLLVILLSSISIVKIASRHWRNRKPAATQNGQIEERPASKRRIQSIDTFRGMSILMMIFVNNGAGGYSVLEHETWDGLFIGDLVFPCFVWIMGLCVPIALTSQLSRGLSRLEICKNILKRSVLLFVLGVCLNTVTGNTQLEKLRIFGVLQRFGVAYLVVGLLYALLSKRKMPQFEHGILAKVNDILALLPQWIVILAILIVYWVISFCIEVPGCPKGYMGPGGRSQNGKFFGCTGGTAGFIDRQILGVDHLYQNPTINQIYESGPFDPEGILGCLTTIFQTFLGVQAGKILRVHKDWRGVITRWMIFALIYGSIGAALHFGRIIPVNKNLWSISFVLITTCFALTLLSACFLLVDVTRIWNGGPFRVPGMNALIIYIGHQVFFQTFPFHWKYGDMNNHTWLTISAIWDVFMWTIIAYVLHHKRIYISL